MMHIGVIVFLLRCQKLQRVFITTTVNAEMYSSKIHSKNIEANRAKYFLEILAKSHSWLEDYAKTPSRLGHHQTVPYDPLNKIMNANSNIVFL